MRNAFFIVLSVALLAGCKKSIVEAVEENLVIRAMTDGQWKVTRFMRDSVDVTGSFSPYRFQFRSDKTVDAINGGNTESKGTWAADAGARTIASAFNGSAAATLQLLNGTWVITNNGWTFVEAAQTVNTEVRTLRLDK